MPIISSVKALSFSDLQADALFEVTVQCPLCGAEETFAPTLQLIRNVVDDYSVHRDAEGEVEWVEGATRLLKCQKCGFATVIKVAVHRSYGVLICNPEETIADKWWEPNP